MGGTVAERSNVIALARQEAPGPGFTWKCGEPGGEGGHCGASGTGREEFVTHMRGHGRRVMGSSVKRLRLKASPPAAVLPKLAFDPLAPVTWTESHREVVPCDCGHFAKAHGPEWIVDKEGTWDTGSGKRRRPGYTAPEGHWTEAGCTECECGVIGYEIEPVVTEVTRTGQFWGVGPSAGTVWVLPYDSAPWEDGAPGPVKLGVRDGAFHHLSSEAGWRGRMEFTERARRHGAFSTPRAGEGVLTRGANGLFREPPLTIHSDPQCPDLASFPESQRAPVSLGRVLEITTRELMGGAELCAACGEREETKVEATTGGAEGGAEHHQVPMSPARAQYERARRELGGDDALLTPEARQAGYTPWPLLWTGGLGRVVEGRTQVIDLASRELWQEWWQKPGNEWVEINEGVTVGITRGAARAGVASARARPTVRAAERDSGNPPGTIVVRGAAPARRPGDVIAVPAQRPDGARILDQAHGFLSHMGHWPNEAALIAATLYAGACHGREKRTVDGCEPALLPVWSYMPRLFLTSRAGGSGKSWLAKMTAALTPSPKRLAEMTKAALISSIGKRHTVIITELDTLVGTSGKRTPWLAGLTNVGYEADGVTSRMRGGEEINVPLFGAMILDGLDKVIHTTGGQLSTLLSRCLAVHVERAPEGYRPPRWDRETQAIAAAISSRMARWMTWEVDDGIGEKVPLLPEGLGNRPADLWEPLLLTADAAGGHWPELARWACERIEAPGGDMSRDAAESAMADAWLDECGISGPSPLVMGDSELGA